MVDAGGNGDGGNDAGDGSGMDAAESGAACDMPDGGAPCNPGIVPCGGDAGGCMTSTSQCCEPNPPDGGAQGTCQPDSVSCPTGTVSFHCKEAADCPSGYVCCESFPAVATLGPTSCMQSCNPPTSYQICRTNSECVGDAGARCIPQTCMSTGIGGSRRASIEACAVSGSANGTLLSCTPN
jgi:hypothetical protein